MIRSARLLAAILPLVGLAALWGMSAKTYSEGTDWEVPIQGYDPRDLLRGHYVEFSYDWPGLGEVAYFRERLCLEGAAPRIDRVTTPVSGPAGDAAPCAHPLKAGESGVYGNSALSRGRLYVGQDRAAQIDSQLRNRGQRGIVTIRQRDDGSFTPIAIRFRPLTPAERAERDAQNAQRAEDLRPPPPMMSQ